MHKLTHTRTLMHTYTCTHTQADTHTHIHTHAYTQTRTQTSMLFQQHTLTIFHRRAIQSWAVGTRTRDSRRRLTSHGAREHALSATEPVQGPRDHTGLSIEQGTTTSTVHERCSMVPGTLFHGDSKMRDIARKRVHLAWSMEHVSSGKAHCLCLGGKRYAARTQHA